jgi:hypothetical protein
MSFKEYEAVGESSLYDGSGPVKAVLSRIAYLIRDKRPTETCPVGWSNVGEAYLAKWTGFSERTVRAAIQTLVEDEIVFRQTYRIPGGFRKNRYSLNMEAINAALRPEFNPDVEEPQAGETYAEPQAGGTYSHRRNRPVPQAGETEATGGSRLKAVGFSSSGKQVELSSSTSQPDTQARFAETRETLDPKKQQPTPVPFDNDDEEEPFPPVHSAPQAQTPPVAPPPSPKPRIVQRANGHRFEQTDNGQRCLACKIHYSQYDRNRRPCPNEEDEIDAVDSPQVRTETPKPKPEVDMRNAFKTHDWSKDKNTCARCGCDRTDAMFNNVFCEQAEGASA